MGDVGYNNAAPCIINPIDHAPTTNSVSQEVSKLAFKPLDVVISARIVTKNGKTPIQSPLQRGIRSLKKTRGIGSEDQLIFVNIFA